MQLVDLIKRKIREDKITIGDEGVFLNADVLETMLTELKQCDEFKETSLVIAKFPVMPDPDAQGETISMKTLLLHQDVRYSGICYLYAINITPKMFSPSEMEKPVKDNCLITPDLMNAETYKLHRKVVMSYEPYTDNGIKRDAEDIKLELKNKIDQIFADEASYTPSGQRHIMLRGLFKYHHYQTPGNIIRKAPAEIKPVPVQL